MRHSWTTKLFNMALGWMQLFLVGGLTMLSTRIVLRELGASDFGIYLVSVSIALLFGILTGAATSLSQRSLAMADLQGRDLNAIMQICFWQHSLLGLFILISGIVIGIFVFPSVIFVPEHRADAASVSYLVTILAMSLGAVFAAFQAFCWSRENFSIFTAANILNAVLTLGAVLMMSSASYDKLVYYATATAFTAAFTQAVASILVLYKYKASRIHLRMTQHSLPLGQGAGLFAWNTIGSSAFILQQQSLVYLLNAFLGPSATAAYGVANQATGVFRAMSQAINSALAPALYRSEASNAREELFSNSALGSKYVFLGVCTLLLPVGQEATYLLELWLKVPPLGASIVVRGTLAAFAIELLSSQYLIAWQAIGKMSGLVIMSLAITVVSIALSCVALFSGADIGLIAAVIVLAGVMNCAHRVWLFRQHYRRAFANWLSTTVVPTVPATIIVLMAVQVPVAIMEQGLLRLVVVAAVSSALYLPIILLNLRRDGIVFCQLLRVAGAPEAGVIK